jgi:hypothetical protein
VPKQKGDKRSADQIPESDRNYYLERKYPSYGNLTARDIAGYMSWVKQTFPITAQTVWAQAR